MLHSLRTIGIAVAGLLLVLFFVHRGFPYERLAGRLSLEAGRALGARVDIPELGPDWMLGGPGVEARGVRVTFQSGARLTLERVALRPAWSLGWLGGTPVLYAELESPSGRAAGVWRADGAWSGDLRGLDLAAVPLESLPPGLVPRGRLDAEIDLRWSQEPEGDVVFEAREGSLQLPTLAMPLPFETCRGELVFGAEHLVRVESFALDGPLLSARASGSLGRAPVLARAPLQIDLELEAAQPPIQALLRQAGVRVDERGAGRLRLGGTPSAPQLR